MAYDEDFAHRIRELLADQDGVTEKAMFGGLAFLINFIPFWAPLLLGAFASMNMATQGIMLRRMTADARSPEARG